MEKLVTEEEYREALKRFLKICNSAAGSPESEELQQLIVLLEIYEQENCPDRIVNSANITTNFHLKSLKN